MAFVNSSIQPSISIAGGVTIDPYDSGTMGTEFESISAGSYNIASGAYSISVFNEGIQDITVNGDTVAPGEKWELKAFSNDNSQKVDFCPEVDIVVPAGGAGKYQVYRPS